MGENSHQFGVLVCATHPQHTQGLSYLSSLKVDRASHTMGSLTQQVWLNIDFECGLNSLLKSRATLPGSIKTCCFIFPK